MPLLSLNSKGTLSLKSAAGQEELILKSDPKDILLLVDTSGSMAGDKISHAKQGAIDFAKSANARGCATALAVFGDRAAMVCDPTLDTGAFQKKISRLDVGLVGGSTNLAAGLQLAGKFKTLNAVVVVTDGQPNSDVDALHAAEVLKEKDIDILCIGTDDADRTFLARLATRSDLAIHVRSHALRKSIGEASALLLRGAK